MKPDFYFITGLPRSRTSWLANFLTSGSSHCYHDELSKRTKQPVPFHKLRESLEIPGKRYIGVSDSGLALWHCELLNQFPEAKWVFIDRDFEEALKSYLRFFTLHPYPEFGVQNPDDTRGSFALIDQYLDRCAASIPRHQKMILDYDALDDAETCSELWEWLIQDEPFEHARWNLLNQLMINPASPKISLEESKHECAVA